ncbi:sugar porter family MFS transporter [Castellaniella sp.]|uniref:sugar porter family MFS transporter n=1 Tax=Castellaniella sp. TaxID=1955812 RepID=UPI002AFFBBE4|nr:sugar porter family MFS transporter [Castellaniella sp.]
MIYFVAAVVGLTGILFGFDEGVIAGALGYLRHTFDISPGNEGLMTAAVPLGALFGAAVAGRAADRFGRRSSLLGAALLFMLGAVAASLITAVWMLSIARLVLGFAVGVAALVAPLYIAESAPAKQRGMLVSIYQLAVTLGILGAYITNFVLDDNWRLMFFLGAVPGLGLFIGMLFLTDTPRWLAGSRGRDAAGHALARLRGLPVSGPQVQAELAQIMVSDQTAEGQQTTGWGELLAQHVRPALVVGVGLFALQQFSGINAVIYYAPTVFQEVGFDSHGTQIMATIGIGVVNVLMTLVGMALIDRIGRKPLLYIGFLGAALSLSMIALGAWTEIPWLDVVAVLGLVIYIAAFAASLGPLPYVMMSEVYPRHIRALGMSVATLANWGLNFVVVFSFPVLVSTIGLGGVFAFYALVCFAGLFFTRRYVPETNGVPLEAIEAHLASGQALRLLRPSLTAQPPSPQAVQDSLALTREQAGQLIHALIQLSPYRQDLQPLADKITLLAYDNHQVRVALYALWQRQGAAVGSHRALGAQKTVLMMFLEHIRYASPVFLTSVGEGPATKGALHG